MLYCIALQFTEVVLFVFAATVTLSNHRNNCSNTRTSVLDLPECQDGTVASAEIALLLLKFAKIPIPGAYSAFGKHHAPMHLFVVALFSHLAPADD